MSASPSHSLETIGRDVGRILQAAAGMMLLSVLVPIVWGEVYAVPGLVVSGLVTLAVGRGLARRYATATEPGKLHGMMIAALGWLAVATVGTLPFLAIAWTVRLDPAILSVPASADTATLATFRNPLNGFFESMSGFTGTGLTMTDDEAILPATLQWWRSFSEWVGGVGVIVLTTAILARPGSGSLTLYESEARSEKIHPSIVSTVRTIWWIFVLFTFAAILLLWLAGMPPWDAINHGMTGLSTGGFAVTDGSIATYDSGIVDLALLPIMLAGSIAFPVHYLVIRGDLRQLYADLQTRWVFGFSALGTVVLIPVLFLSETYDGPLAAARYGAFQFVSAATCTGFQTAGGLGEQWPAGAVLAVTLGMVVGGAAGSTVGGIKLIRALTLLKGTAYRIRGVFYPDTAVRPFQVNGRILSDVEAAQEFEEAAIVAFLWVVFLGLGLAVLLASVPVGSEGFTLEAVLFEVASAQGNVGLSAGITGPSMPTPAKVIFLFNMWIGRLEIIPVLVLLRGAFRRGGVYG